MNSNFQKLSSKFTLTDRACPLSEYPRPNLVRNSYLCLNGEWDYSITKRGEVLGKTYLGKILVPFSPESDLSGVSRRLLLSETLWYKRTVEIPTDFFSGRIILHFGAVDQFASVFINGKLAVCNYGGYYPFSADITEFIEGDKFEIVVSVVDVTDTSFHETGKQRIKRGGIWYTPQSGIWQTVWLESVPENYLMSIKTTPDFDGGLVRFDIEREGDFSPNNIVVRFKDKVVFEDKFEVDNFEVELPSFEAWSPETPNLYDYEITSGKDHISGYFGMRKVEIKESEGGQRRIYLNGKLYLNNGLLDQGYWPEGLYTPPSDESMIYDIQLAKRLGFNMLRKHIKIEPLRWYYHADRIGMLVWQDMISGGEKYNPFVTMYLPFAKFKLKDSKYKHFGRGDKRSREGYYEGLSRMIGLLYNFPSIVCWVPFNEGWGQFDAKSAYSFVKEMDGTRLIDHASGWHDQGFGDFDSKHIYYRKLFLDDDKRASALTEFGGFSYKIDEHSFNLKKTFGYKLFKDKAEYNKAVYDLYMKELLPLVARGYTALCYTQLTDVEDETNGIATYDRKVTKIDEEMMKKINKELFDLHSKC